MFSTYTTKKYLLNIYNVKFYNLDKKFICRKIYGNNYQKHPYSKKFLKKIIGSLVLIFKKLIKKSSA